MVRVAGRGLPLGLLPRRLRRGGGRLLAPPAAQQGVGPATQDGDKDPRVAMKKDRERRKQLWLDRKAAAEQGTTR